MQLVFEFGAPDALSVVETMRSILGKEPAALQVRWRKSDEYVRANISLESVPTRLENGEIVAASVHPTKGPIRYALAMRPRIDGSKLSLFVGAVELTDSNYTPIWKVILNSQGLIFATLGYDERVEIDDDKLSADAFPWRDWPMIVGALRSSPSTNPWTIYEGPEIRWFRAGGPHNRSE